MAQVNFKLTALLMLLIVEDRYDLKTIWVKFVNANLSLESVCVYWNFSTKLIVSKFSKWMVNQ